MMEFTSEERYLFCRGLDLQIQLKEAEIKSIQQRTEEDYKIIKNLYGTLLEGEFSLAVAINNDVKRVRDEIVVLMRLRERMNNLRNRILEIPEYIQLHLTGSEK